MQSFVTFSFFWVGASISINTLRLTVLSLGIIILGIFYCEVVLYDNQ